ncbi:MAG: MATE family efflux transporter [Gemmatimonadetes bacterium]|nr:MATE family efflux transporter [Gemmatimonadota bacterium]
MHDLTSGSIPRHILRLAAPMAIGMVLQTLYYLIDLWFVAKLGDAAVAGVASAGTVQFVVMAFTQVLSVGTMVLVSHAAGRKDREDATLVFNQGLGLSLGAVVGLLIVGYALIPTYVGTLAADAAAMTAGVTYLRWFLPALALQFSLVSIGAALRGTGVTRPTMVVQAITVLCNAILAPVLIAGWGTGRPLGVAGAGLASTISVALGVALLLGWFRRLETFVRFDRHQLMPRRDVVVRMLRIGVPAGGEFAIIFIGTGVTYWIIRGFGPEAQAGYGIGSRIMQAFFLPAMAIAFAAAPVAGQNVGAGRADRAHATFRDAALMGSALMAALTVLCNVAPASLVRIFTPEPAVVEVGAEFLRVISWNFVAQGLVFTCSGIFQALGNTVPSLVVATVRLLTFALPAVWLSRQPGFTLHRLWLLSTVAAAATAILSFVLVRRALVRATAARMPGFTAVPVEG